MYPSLQRVETEDDQDYVMSACYVSFRGIARASHVSDHNFRFILVFGQKYLDVKISLQA
jgi:hypothetical protein